MSTLIIIVIGVTIFMVLLAPFFSKQTDNKNQAADGNDFQEKEHIFSQLADLEYDFQMGKLSEKDFVKTKGELTAKAAKFVRSENKLEQTQWIVDQEISTHIEKYGLASNTEVRHEN
ncbi:hypothetical protein [Virgibacillus oceani]|uniref:C-type cytochrome biogenesis protein CcmI n=1 Tax=Virgibacillus oceani TaxID=1479511 RepID=A0A917GY38_9BACI|nr:hypothetical protein [Virgibacillus oceani]GGG61014.1 hypothetical protein GCM10011398_00310 [Virgibacillus oceani]